jgi:hypothetical protein
VGFILKRLSSIVSSLFDEIPDSSFLEKFHEQFASIGTDAYNWNHIVKSTFKSLDFCPVLFTNAVPFDPASMTLSLSHRADELLPTGSKIALGVSLALLSKEAVGTGEKSVWQTKAEVAM